jgi:threonine/homoserine/homoserine lactone efflux protein
MNWLGALVLFSFVSAVTPGPNNILLWASGAEFGLRRTIPQVIGTAVGVGLLALLIAAGLSVVITVLPKLALVMKVAGSVYLLYLAYQIAGARALERGRVSRPMSAVQAASFQAINPKAWIFALGAITTFRPATLPIVEGSILVALTMMAVVIPSASLWAGAGGVVSRFLSGRASRIVSLLLAVMLAATVVYVWI